MKDLGLFMLREHVAFRQFDRRMQGSSARVQKGSSASQEDSRSSTTADSIGRTVNDTTAGYRILGVIMGYLQREQGNI